MLTADRCKVAVIHDWLVTYAGAERVLEQILKCFPEADLFCVVNFLDENDSEFLRGHKVTPSLIQKLPYAKTKYRQYLPLMPWAIKQWDLSGYGLIISSSHAVAKGIRRHPHQLHLSYIHTPMRYAWDLQDQYLEEANLNKGMKSWVVRWLLKRLRAWDLKTATGVDGFMANSRFIAQRIKNNYQRDSEVIYPPVKVENFSHTKNKEEFYLTASRMVPYKKIDLIVEAFSTMPEKHLVVIGDGPEMMKVKSKAGPNVILMGYQKTEVLKDYMERARAFVFAAEEDFGITVVEAQACGVPVIAYGKGGALETVRGLDQEKPTGVFFNEQSVPSLLEAIRIFEANKSKILPENCRENALRFGEERFRDELKSYIEREWGGFKSKISF